MNGYPRSAWYMAGWDRQFPAAEPRGEKILGEPIVLYRTGERRMVALEDRCVHRLAPLSLGRCEGANLRCMYHGLLYAPDGRCVALPGQSVVPSVARVRAYPVVEKWGVVWVWMGDPARADDALIPEFKGYTHADWAMEPGQIDYQASAKLIHDNLLDLSHVAYVHASSFGGGNAAASNKWIDADMNVETLARGVRVARWMEEVPLTPAGGLNAIADTGPADMYTCYEFLVPGIFIQFTGRYPAGTYRRVGGALPDAPSMFSSFTCQAVTPLTAQTSRYFFAFGPESRHASQKEFFAKLGVRAFEEDRRMIEAQQGVIDSTASPRMLPMAMDKAVRRYELLVERLIRDEAASAGN